MDEESLLEPRKYYESHLKTLHQENASTFFDELVDKSGINIEENKKTITELNKVKQKIAKCEKKKTKFKTYKAILIVLIILVLICSIINVWNLVEGNDVVINIVLLVVSIVLFAISLYLIFKKINVEIKKYDKLLEDLEKKKEDFLETAQKQMEPLNKLYDWGICSMLAGKTCPLIKFDKNFNPQRYEFLHERFDFNEDIEDNISTVFVQSGEILGNPFLFQKRFVQKMQDKTYSGSIVIHWTTTQYVNGKSQRVSHSETLVATVVRPKPYYYLDTWLIYGNDAAPKLSFSRSPSTANSMNEKEIDRFVRKSEKKLDNMVKNDMGDKDGNGSEFMRLANTKFESLFKAYNRNNELEFRLLFTPLAQQNIIDLITNKKPYGDDFTFIKKSKINYIRSEHAQHNDISGNPIQFFHYDYELAKKQFVSINENYFQSVFFDFAPLISIPLYQQHKTKEYIYNETYETNITKFEHEVLANALGQSKFVHPQTNTAAILKAVDGTKDGKKDRVKILAHTFKEEPRVKYIEKFGGDGHLHSIPVHYYEYIPLTQETIIGAEEVDNSSQTESNNDIIKQRGLMAYIIK